MRDDELREIQTKFARRPRRVLAALVVGFTTMCAWFLLGFREPIATFEHVAAASALVAWIAVILLNSRCPACGATSRDFLGWCFCPECGVPLT